MKLTPIAAINKILDILIAIVLVILVCNPPISAFSALVAKLLMRFPKDLCFADV
jgi:hypothetical protein